MKFNVISVVVMGGDKGSTTVSSAGPFDDMEAAEVAAAELRKRIIPFIQAMVQNIPPGQCYSYSMPSSYVDSVQVFVAATSTAIKD
jgi:hypothetical protein